MNILHTIYQPLHTLGKGIQKIIETDLFSLGISYSEMRILMFVYDRTEDLCTQEELTSHLKIDRSNVGRAVQKLVSKGYIERVKDEQDTRVAHISLTKIGKQIEPEVIAGNEHAISLLQEQLTTAERETLITLLKKAACSF